MAETVTLAPNEPPLGRLPMPRTFRQLLANTLITGVTSTFLWFALTFWVYLETRSVVATGVVGGAFTISSAVLSPYFGTFVDRHRKHASFVMTTAVSALCFAVAAAVYASVDNDRLLRLSSPWFWVLVAATLFGSVAGQMRGIALSTCVTLLVPDGHRDRANGMIGSVMGVSFAITSVFSGIGVGGFGMGWCIVAALVVTLGALLHVLTIRIDEPEPERGDGRQPVLDVRAAVEAIRATPGLAMLIAFTAFNNLVAGVFMALMDAYGLSLVSVETWGLLWGVISLAFIAGGLAVARRGLGNNPLRVMLACNLINWLVCSVFALRSSIVMLAVGMVVWLGMVPAIEAAEQTILQRSIPFERQGRVFGFAQFVESAASPLTAFLMAPLAEVLFIPLMTDGAGADAIGSWFGTGPERGLALMFVIAGLVGAVVTVGTWSSRSYRRLAGVTQEAPVPVAV